MQRYQQLSYLIWQISTAEQDLMYMVQYHYTMQNTTVAKKQTNVHTPTKQAVVADAHQGTTNIYSHDV